MRVVDLWRFPVKSMGGEQLERAEVGELGIAGDRQWAVRNLTTGKTLTGRREPKLLFASARYTADGDVDITLPDGHTNLTKWLGYDVELVRAGPGVESTFEHPPDFETEQHWIEWNGPDGVFHDSARRRLSIVSLDTLGDWDRRRFRTNVIVDGAGEDDLLNNDISIGSVALHVTRLIDRCVMTTRPQPGIERDLDVLRTINKERDGNLAIGCVITQPGVISIGDAVEVR